MSNKADQRVDNQIEEMPTCTSDVELCNGLLGRSLCVERGNRVLFQGLDLCVRPGQIVLIGGRNGSGKTTLLRVLCGLRAPDEGTLFWNGEVLDQQRDEIRHQMTYLGHSNGIKNELSVVENLRVSAVLNCNNNPNLHDTLDILGLTEYSDTPARRLSAGQRRRLALARVLSSKAQLWLLDEPFTALDRQAVIDFSRMMVAHTKKGGMIVVTAHHDLQLGDADVQRLDLSA